MRRGLWLVWLLLLLVSFSHAQTIKGGAKVTAGAQLVSGGGSSSGNWNPNVVLANMLFNNTANAYSAGENVAPQVGTTSNQSVFPGESETRFALSSVVRGASSSTVNITVYQGNLSGNNTYNFSATDSITLSNCSPLNGTYAVNTVNASSLDIALTGSALTVNNCIGVRTNAASDDQYLPSGANVANWDNDGVDVHDLLFGNGNGDTIPVMFHLMPWFSCPAGACDFAPKPNMTLTGSHIRIGYVSNSTAQVHAQRLQMQRYSQPGLPVGIIEDLGGSTTVLDKWRDELAGQSTFLFAFAIDNSGFKGPCGVTAANTPTCIEQYIEDRLSYAKTATASTYTSPLDGSTQSGGGYFPSTAYWDNPTSGQPIVLAFINGESSWFNSNTGTVNTSGTAVTWVSGTQWDNSWAGQKININGTLYTVASAASNTALTLTTSAGTQTGVTYTSGCTAGIPCPVYNAGVAGTTCTSSADCWAKLKAGIASYISSWATGLKPEFYWRNAFSNNSSINAGGYTWMNVTTNAASPSYPDSTITAANSATTKNYIHGLMARVNHAQSSFEDDANNAGGQCGQTAVAWAKRPMTLGFYGPSTSKYYLGVQVITWNDYEEGTAIEPGIPICYNATANVVGNAVNWTLGTTNSTYAPIPLNTSTNDTLDHIALLAVKSGGTVGGKDTQVLATTSPAASGTFNLTSIPLDNGNYTLYVRVVPKALMTTYTTSGMSYTK